MIKPLNEMTSARLENLKVRLKSIVLGHKAEINRRQIRLDNRVERQTVANVVLAVLEDKLAKSIAVRDELIAAGASGEAITTSTELVASNQAALDDYDVNPSFLSDEDAHIEQSEIEELEEGLLKREAKIATIESLLPG